LFFCVPYFQKNDEHSSKDKQLWLESFLELPYGIPIEDTYRRVFAVLDPKEFQKRFLKWIQSTVYVKTGSVIAIDGKTLRGCKGKGVTSKHIVNAWSSACRVTLGQCRPKREMERYKITYQDRE
jgi:hypothetical protein